MNLIPQGSKKEEHHGRLISILILVILLAIIIAIVYYFDSIQGFFSKEATVDQDMMIRDLISQPGASLPASEVEQVKSSISQTGIVDIENREEIIKAISQ